MTSYKKYPKYKDSNVAWLGEIPEHWISVKFKQVLEEKKKKTNLSLNCGSISFGTVVYKDNEKIPAETKASYQEVLKGEFLINPLNLNFDLKSLRTALSTLDVVVSTGYIVLKHKSNINPYYLRWLLYQFDVAHMKTLGAGVRQTVNFTNIGNEYFFIPPLQEQQAIANYLDKATAKIDTLIQKQEKLIELLKEKRQALISHAVTKGLNPDAKMKDSGIKWLGEIPEHWEVKKTKHIFSLIVEPAHTNNTYELLSIYTDIGVKPRKDMEAKGNKATTTDGYWKVQKKDIIVNKLLAWMGAIGVSNYDGVTSPAYDILRPNKNIDSDFYHLLFRTKKAQIEFKKWSRGIMEMRLRLYFSEFGQIKMPVPSYDEQKQIVYFIEEKTSKIDELITKATKAIDLLKEKKTALISAAVTGKIDVRENI